MDETLQEAGHPLVGKRLGAYRIEYLLGAGAMGEVFRGVHETLGRPVAIKTLKPEVAADRSLMERFFAEARAVNIIRHENIVECTDMVNDPAGQSYIVMELLEGTTLTRAIEDAGRIPPRRAVRIAVQIADAIGAAHDKGIIHRDLKPDNVFLIRRAGSSDYVKVLDFGIARLRPELGVTATQSGMLVGTPAYMSPEQARGERVESTSDIYAVGLILFHMLVGELPFKVPSMAMMLVAQLTETPRRVDALRPDIPKPLADLIVRVLAKEPAKRPASMAELRVALLESVGLPVEVAPSLIMPMPGRELATQETLAQPSALPKGAGTSSLSAAAGEAASASPRRRRPVVWIAAAGIVIATGITVPIALRGRSTETPTVREITGAPAILPSAAAPVVDAALDATVPIDAAIALDAGSDAGATPTTKAPRPRIAKKPVTTPDPVPVPTPVPKEDPKPPPVVPVDPTRKLPDPNAQ